MRNTTIIIKDQELPVVTYQVQQGSESFFLNNIKKPQLFLSHGVYRFYQTDFSNREALLFGLTANNSIFDNNYVKYYLENQNVSYNNYITMFKPGTGTYVEVKCTYLNTITSLEYFHPMLSGFGNIAFYCPQDNFNLFLCLSTTTSIELLADEYKIFIPITLSYSNALSSLSGLRINLKTVNSQTISAFSLSATETRSVFSNTTNYAYTLTYMGIFPPLCATMFSVLKSLK
jgi:hypothetical protein